MKKANKALLVALLGAGLTLASCGGTETSSSASEESTTTSASSEAGASSEVIAGSSSETTPLPDSSESTSIPDVVDDYLVDIVETTGVHITSNLKRVGAAARKRPGNGREARERLRVAVQVHRGALGHRDGRR